MYRPCNDRQEKCGLPKKFTKTGFGVAHILPDTFRGCLIFPLLKSISDPIDGILPPKRESHFLMHTFALNLHLFAQSQVKRRKRSIHQKDMRIGNHDALTLRFCSYQI